MRVTPSYETQRLFSTYSGNQYISSSLTADERIARRITASIVEDTKTGKRYLKVVNALPTPLTLSIEGITIPQGTAWEGISGQPSDQRVAPEKGATDSEGITLPPYTLRVFSL